MKCSGEAPCRTCRQKRIICTFSVKQRPGPKGLEGKIKQTKKRKCQNNKKSNSKKNSSLLDIRSLSEQAAHLKGENDDGGAFARLPGGIGVVCKCNKGCSNTSGNALVSELSEEALLNVSNTLLSLKHANT